MKPDHIYWGRHVAIPYSQKSIWLASSLVRYHRRGPGLDPCRVTFIEYGENFVKFCHISITVPSMGSWRSVGWYWRAGVFTIFAVARTVCEVAKSGWSVLSFVARIITIPCSKVGASLILGPTPWGNSYMINNIRMRIMGRFCRHNALLQQINTK
jgi:hypothetical protein